MHPRKILAGAGVAFVASTLACAGGSTATADRAPPPSVVQRRAQVRTEAPNINVPPVEAPASEAEPEQPISAPVSHQPPPRSGLAVLGELATAQALIVSLLVAPFSSGRVDPNAPRDPRVPR